MQQQALATGKGAAMFVELKAGTKVDLFSGEEAERHFAKLEEKLKSLDNIAQRTWMTQAETVTTDAAGLLGGGRNGNGVELFHAPTGFICQLHRIAVSSTAATPAAPIAQGWLAWYRGAPSSTGYLMSMPTGGSTTVAPFVIEEGSGGVVVRQGEKILLAGEGLPANTTFAITLQFRMNPVVTR